jgi:hypothetical protein
VRRTILLAVTAALLFAGCDAAGRRGTVVGYFRLPGAPAADLQRGGLNFAEGRHGHGHGHTTRVEVDGRYTITLSPGSYEVIGGLSGHPGGPPPEKCAATMNVVVTANGTTRADYVCHATPVNASTP